jgi:eukaryotic-like serine/threonine-protein kinase
MALNMPSQPIADDIAATQATAHSTQSGEPVQENPAAENAGGDGAPKVGALFDRFLIKRLLGRGGMGEVYLAEEQTPLVRWVALKVIANARMSIRERTFFELESQVLARMQHPNVAQIFEVATSASGRPLIAMEYVDGAQIHDYCDTHKLDVRARLTLFLGVLRGVAHAHQKGVIHRDLKPANILVSLVDGQPQPKLIDFGIATQANAQTIGARATSTEPGEVLLAREQAGTPFYMSPEQSDVRVEAAQIDTRSDLYSLGIVLYRLLTGCLPYASASDAFGAGIGTGSKTLQRAEQVLSQLSRDELLDVAHARRVAVDQLKRSLSGDLSWILWRATRPEREDRYETADAFGADIQRFLNHDVVHAAPKSKRTALKKFIRRNQLAVALSAVALVAALGGAGLAWSGYRAAQFERDAAVAARAQAEIARASAVEERTASDAVNEFMTQDLLGQAAVNRSGDATKVTLLEAIERAAEEMGTRLADQPGVEGRVRLAIGGSLKDLSQFPKAKIQLDLAYALLSKALGPQSDSALKAYSELGHLALRTGDFDTAKSYAEQGYRRAVQSLGVQSERAIGFAAQRAILAWQTQDVKNGIDISEATLKLPVLVQHGDDGIKYMILNNLGRLYRLDGRMEDAEKAHQDAIAWRTKEFGADAFATLEALNDLAGLYRATKQLDRAEALYRQIIISYQKVYGPDHASTATAINNLAKVVSNKGNDAQALTLYAQALGITERVLGKQDYLYASICSNQAMSLLSLRRPKESLPLFLAADAIFAKNLPLHHRQRQGLFSGLAANYEALGDKANATAVRRKIIVDAK